jgi:diguanylate cyclase (GGDEF)-like protein
MLENKQVLTYDNSYRFHPGPLAVLLPPQVVHGLSESSMTNQERTLNTSLLMLVPPGIMAAAWAVYNFPVDKFGIGLVMLALVTVFFSAFLRIQLPRTNLHLTISDALVFLSLLVYGGGVAVLLAMLEAAFSSLRLRTSQPSRSFTSWRTVSTNVLTAGFSTFATAFLVETLFGSPSAILASGDNTVLVYLLAVMAVAQFASNTFLASAYLAIKTERRLLDVWNEYCFNALALFCSGAVMAGLAAKAVQKIDMVQFALAAGFLGLIFLTFKRYTDDVSRAATEVEAAKSARADDAEAHISELNHFVEELRRTAEELTESRESFRHAAYHDPITDLPNRTYILELIDQLLKKGGLRSDVKFAVMLINLNRFRTINESLGYHTGDRVIKHLADRLGEVSIAGEIVGHFGGDKFAIILPCLSDDGSATDFAELVSKRISEAIVFKGRQVYTSANIGLVFRDPKHTKGEEMLRDADIAMYHAKDNRKAWVVFDKSMRATAVSRQQMETDLRYAIVCNELEMFYQPIIDLNSITLYGFEALVRWNHPQKGMILPSEFIPLSEDTGLVIPMTLQILRNACSQVVEWQGTHPDNKFLTMSVNLSGKHFADASLVEQVGKILEETAIDPQCLKLEITESSTMEDAENAIEKLNEIRKSGVKVSIDDFGTGYSSLSYLRRFPVDTLKIDRSFVSGMDEATENNDIVRTIMALAKSLNLDVVAEGIENVQQLAILRRLGCEFGQGYLFAPPLPVAAIEGLLGDPTKWTALAAETDFPGDQRESDFSALEFTN